MKICVNVIYLILFLLKSVPIFSEKGVIQKVDIKKDRYWSIYINVIKSNINE